MASQNKRRRAGGVYIAVLGTSLIAALLGLAALMAQRIQNRILVAAADIRQAQLNSHAAAELALLTMKQNANWRTSNPNGNWFANRPMNGGSCSVDVVDPIDANLANGDDDPVVVLGVGYAGQAEQRLEVTIDPRKEPYGSLRSAVAAGDNIDLQSDTLRTNGLITANQVSASSSLVYGDVEAVSISGSTYAGTTTQVIAEKRPAMPDWASAFSYYKTNGTQLSIGNLPMVTPNLGRNTSFDSNANYWTGTGTGLPVANVSRDTNINGHAACLRVHGRTATTAGASQYIDHFVKPGGIYTISIQVCAGTFLGNAFRIKLATKGTGAVQTSASATFLYLDGAWHDISFTLTAPSWSGPLEYARITIDTDALLGTTVNFYIDNLDIREATAGRFIYRQVLAPGVNTLYTNAPLNPQGIYWIDCQGNRLVIERSRILGTLLVLNPGPNSGVTEGPISWGPAVAGYPALLVDADTPADANFSLGATNRVLSEVDNEVNYNPAGAPYDFANSLCSSTDGAANDIYASEIRGLIAVRNDLSYQNYSLVRGQVIVGGEVSNSSGELEVQFQPDSLLNPPPGFWAPYSYMRRPSSARKVVQ
jgi:hypothetical protein